MADSKGLLLLKIIPLSCDVFTFVITNWNNCILSSCSLFTLELPLCFSTKTITKCGICFSKWSRKSSLKLTPWAVRLIECENIKFNSWNTLKLVVSSTVKQNAKNKSLIIRDIIWARSHQTHYSVFMVQIWNFIFKEGYLRPGLNHLYLKDDTETDEFRM